jgi:cellobiose phosphorylase
VALTQHILGIRPDYDGLVIDPCIPPEWKGFSVHRKFRGATYHITVANPNGLSKGVRRLVVDGTETDGNKAPIFDDAGEHEILAILER